MRFIYLEVIFFCVKELYTPFPGAIDGRQTVNGATHHPIYNKMCMRKKKSQYFDCFCFCFYSDNRDHFKGRSILGRFVAVFLRADCCIRTPEIENSSVFLLNSRLYFVRYYLIHLKLNRRETFCCMEATVCLPFTFSLLRRISTRQTSLREAKSVF